MQYYQQLIQQGYSPLAAAQYTKQYFPEFQDPKINPSLHISPNAASIPQPSVQNSIEIGFMGHLHIFISKALYNSLFPKL